VIALGATFNLVTVYYLITTPELVKAFGSSQLHAQVDLLLHSFRSDWAKLFGIIVFILGVGWIVAGARPYF
jgi:hypothetical protein